MAPLLWKFCGIDPKREPELDSLGKLEVLGITPTTVTGTAST